MRTLLSLLVLLVPVAAPLLAAAAAPPPTNDPRWAQAKQAYEGDRDEEGHTLLLALVADRPGDFDLAVACYQTILTEEGRIGTTNPWINLASRRLVALERIGALSANTDLLKNASADVVDRALEEGRHLEVREHVDRLHAQNHHDLFWRINHAFNYRRMDLAEARPLFQALKEELDPDHPHTETREHWGAMEKELTFFDALPKPILPLPKGSPLLLMEPDDPDGHWRTVLDRAPLEIPEETDRLAAHAFSGEQLVLWQDMTGLTDPPRALDLHLLAKPAPDLKALRKSQDENFAREVLPDALTEEQVLHLSRRFAWAREAQKLLLDQANDALWDGRSQSALRSFHELLAHTVDPALKDAAQVGSWTALKLSGLLEELRASAGAIDPGKEYPWMGKKTKGSEIRTALLKGTVLPPPVTPPSLQGIAQHVLQLPPVSPWPTDTPGAGLGIDLQVAGQQVLATGRNMIVSYDAAQPGSPLWSHVQRHPLEENRKTGYHPGYYRPLIDGTTIYTRWGLTSLPSGLAAFDLAGGRPLWSDITIAPDKRKGRRVRFRYAVPTGDPVRADSMLFYLQWGTVHDVNDRRGRSMSLVCFDPHKREPRWTTTIAEAGQTLDFVGNLESASPQSAIYGNSVTVHRGAVYSNTNAGLIARSDVRDGRIDWIHYYRRSGSNLAPANLGSAPIVAGDTIICMPRDTGRLFALDQRTGRLVWDNPLVLATEALGVFEDLLIVRGVSTLAGLDLKTGQARWFRPLPERILGRSVMIGDSVYLGRSDELRRFDARTGTLLEKHPWILGEDRPLAFTVAKNKLYVISDRPAADKRQQLGKPLVEAPAESVPLALPLRRTWTLSRSDARIALPPPGAGLDDTAFVLSGGILECLDLSPQGSVLWRRFVDAHNATLSFADGNLLLVERNHTKHTSGRAVAFSAREGKFLWESPVPANLGHSLRFGSRILFHDRRGKLAAYNLKSGERLWERRLGEAHIVDPNWDGQRLHIFHAAPWNGPHLLEIDPDSGATITNRNVMVTHATSSPNHGRRIENGYYEVRTPPKPARFVRLATLSDIGGRGWASAAELHVLDAEGKRIPRDKWTVEAEHERNAAPRALPRNLIDGDPNSWWHSQWKDPKNPSLGLVPPHPHHVHIDLGETHTVSGFHYLPAKIINNNGLIRDYEWHVREVRQDWGEPEARGILVNRLHVDRSFFGPRALFFEARNYPQNDRAVFRCEFGAEHAVRVESNAQLLSMHGRYAVISTRDAENKQILVLRRSDDPAYRFILTPAIDHGRHGEIVIDGDRLITGRHKIVIADLNSRRFLSVPKPDEKKSPRHRNGALVRLGKDHFLKIVHHNNKQSLAMVNLNTGQVTEGTLETQIEPFREDRFLKSEGQRLLAFNRTLLFYDNATLSAWVAGVAK